MMKSITDLNNMKITDSHVHFWNLSRLDYPWLKDVPQINVNSELAEFEKATQLIAIEAIVFVQCECLANQYEQEIAYVTALAAMDDRIKAIIPYFPLCNKNIGKPLNSLTQNSLIKGIRRLEEEPVSLYMQPQFLANLKILKEYNLSFDLGIKSHQMEATIRLLDKVPDNRYILDHMAKPPIKSGGFNTWYKQLKEIAAHPNVYCKLSGLTTEANWDSWNMDDLEPYFAAALELFGVNRLCFGSDWPVVNLGSNYANWLGTALDLCVDLNSEDKRRIFHQNTLDFYQIDRKA